MCLVVNKNYKSEKNYSLSFSSLRRDVQISHLIKKKKMQQYEQTLLQVKGYKKHLFLYQFFFKLVQNIDQITSSENLKNL